MRYYIFGYGRMGRIRDQIMRELGHTCVGIYDPQFPEYSDRSSLQPAPGELVFVCVPSQTTWNLVKSLKASGAYLFVEKPYHGTGVFVGWSHRYHPQVQRLRTIGFRYLELIWVRRNGIPGGWFCQSNVWDDLGSHLLDMAQYICGCGIAEMRMHLFEFSDGDILYKADWWGGDDFQYVGPDNAVSLLRMENGTIVHIRVAWASPEDEKFVIQGYTSEQGYIQEVIDPMADDIFRKEIEEFLHGIL